MNMIDRKEIIYNYEKFNIRGTKTALETGRAAHSQNIALGYGQPEKSLFAYFIWETGN